MTAAVVAVLPTLGGSERLDALLDVVLPDVSRAIVLDAGRGAPIAPRKRLVVLPADDRGRYRLLNVGWRLARAYAREVDVAILSEEARILPGTVATLARALRVRDDVGVAYPDETTPLRAGLPKRIRLDIDRDPLGGREIAECCFVARGDLPIPGPFDEGYAWSYGETQFDEAVRLVGYGVARVLRVPVARDRGAREVSEADGRRFDSLHVRVIDGRWWPVSERYAG